ncbi:Uncharacterized conserved protein YeaO, DUF488 family [Salinibacillus kushneri]|uniref:Uncharacterized conserved protein YeaO, DUF488 family n=1 Tax=Salinibacillus kushneri TaxID=237682 RepID=A0A1I0CRM3_9BACI|nr:DUF488 domain-containing protein [Salinibacillus kushneri]SET21708.1 Uncharacterized conserved protein YeaO, DUF488 family [Salinibacillus kushneri]
MSIQTKRIYEEALESDGTRILVDRVWPRGISKQRAQLDEWLKDITPSTELRKWFQHDPDKFKEFSEAYRQELATHSEKIQAVDYVRDLAMNKTITLLYAAKDPVYNHVNVLKEYLEQNGENPFP